jgi:hypothetical protein
MEEQNLTNSDQVSSLNEIINSIKLADSENSVQNNIKELELNDDSNLNEINNLSNYTINNPEQTIRLLSNDIDRKIGDYLLNEITKKNSYIEELEEIIKYQESEISQLKSKLESINKIELISKLKSNMETKSEIINNSIDKLNSEQSISENLNQDEKNSSNKQVQVIKIKKISDTNIPDVNSYQPQNQDLNLNANSRLKTKSLSKEEEPLTYNGIVILEKIKKEIVIEKSSEIENDDCEKSDILKQRRRARRL